VQAGRNNSNELSGDRRAAQESLDGARILTTAGYRQAVFARLLDRLIERFEADRGFAIFATEEGALDLKANHNLSVGDVQSEEPIISHTIVEDVAARRKSVLIEDALAHPVLKEQTSVVGQGIRSVMCVPMVAGDELLGVIYADNLSQGGKFGPGDLEMLTLVGSYAAAALWGARLLAFSAQRASATEAGTAALRGMAAAESQETAAAPKSDELSAVAAGLAHDFNNVLAAIQARLQLLQGQAYQQFGGQDVEGKLAPNIAKAQEAVQTARGLAKQITNYAAVVSTAAFAEVNLSEVVEEVVRLVGYRFEEGGGQYALELSLPDNMPVRGNRTQLEEMVLNLFSNALDAMPQGGRLSVSLRSEGDCCLLEVQDTGHGIPEEIKDRLFEPFVSTKGGKGVGLGLSMVKAVVSKHEGRIELESAPHKGALFRVYLPLCIS